jgi:hypothetical protein
VVLSSRGGDEFKEKVFISATLSLIIMALKRGFYRHFKGGVYEFLGAGIFSTRDVTDKHIGKGFHSKDLSRVDVFRSNGGLVLDGSGSSGGDGEFVVYQAQYDTEKFGNMPIWVRPIEEFTGTKTIDGKEVPRFEYLGEEKPEEV